MIAAEFVPACPSAWHRAVLELVLAGRWSDIPLATWPPLVWFAAPAAVITALALVAVMLKRPRALVLVLGLSAFVNLWLPLALAPLLFATRPWPPMEQWRTTLTVAAALLLGAFVATPSCDRVVDGFALAPPVRLPAMVFASHRHRRCGTAGSRCRVQSGVPADAGRLPGGGGDDGGDRDDDGRRGLHRVARPAGRARVEPDPRGRAPDLCIGRPPRPGAPAPSCC